MTEEEAARKKREDDLEIQRIKAMKEGRTIETPSGEGRMVRIVQRDMDEKEGASPVTSPVAKSGGKVRISAPPKLPIKPSSKVKSSEKAKTSGEAPVEGSKLGVRAKKALLAAGITDFSELKGKKKKDLTAISGIGDKAADEILTAI